ncbi:glutathione S-transferase PARB-like [Argentina anserina]|uniref:glutathione S-transferase PARB-like n=1 Tax=Argentina anserina TaxID=57926 RepID=UPI00217678B8|nr:glutathione S-transferase PARB-like [Potentilla anserina]
MGHMYANKLQEGEELIFWESWKQSLVANWIDVEDHFFEAPTLKLISMLSSKAEINGKCNGFDREIDELNKVMDVYEAQLGKSKYLTSDKFTVADVLHLPNMHTLIRFSVTKKLIDSRPRVSAWCSEILARSSWTKVLQMQQQKMIAQT